MPHPLTRLFVCALLSTCAACESRTGDVASRARALDGAPADVLIEHAGHPDWRARSAALIAMQSRSDTPGVIAAVRTALSDPNARVRAHAASVLYVAARGGGGVDRPAIDALARAIGDREWSVRARAIEALGALGREAAHTVNDVADALGDPNDVVRNKAVWALGEFGAASRPALERIRRMAGDPNPVVRVHVPGALLKITSGDTAERDEETDEEIPAAGEG